MATFLVLLSSKQRCRLSSAHFSPVLPLQPYCWGRLRSSPLPVPFFQGGVVSGSRLGFRFEFLSRSKLLLIFYCFTFRSLMIKVTSGVIEDGRPVFVILPKRVFSNVTSYRQSRLCSFKFWVLSPLQDGASLLLFFSLLLSWPSGRPRNLSRGRSGNGRWCNRLTSSPPAADSTPEPLSPSLLLHTAARGKAVCSALFWCILFTSLKRDKCF